MNFIPQSFGYSSNIVVAGYDPERADYSNPKGEYYKEVFYVTAQNEYGDRYCLLTNMNEEQTAKLAKALQARWDNLQKLPINFGEWFKDSPVYGSDAYSDYGQYDDFEREMIEEGVY